MRKTVEILLCILALQLLLAGCGGDSTGGEQRITARVLEVNENSAVVEALESEDISKDSLPRYSFGTSDLDDIGAEAGDVVNIIYVGDVMETWPMQIQAVSWGIDEKASESEKVEAVDAKEEAAAEFSE